MLLYCAVLFGAVSQYVIGTSRIKQETMIWGAINPFLYKFRYIDG